MTTAVIIGSAVAVVRALSQFVVVLWSLRANETGRRHALRLLNMLAFGGPRPLLEDASDRRRCLVQPGAQLTAEGDKGDGPGANGTVGTPAGSAGGNGGTGAVCSSNRIDTAVPFPHRGRCRCM
jgi:hypothetical protein